MNVIWNTRGNPSYSRPALFTFLIFVNIFSAVSQNKDSIVVDDLLKLSLTELMDVKVTTAAKISQNLRETPTTVRVISAEQIRERGYFTL